MSDGTETTETISLLPPTLKLDCCCAYLCNLCPRTSFHSMDLLEQHMIEEHQQNGNGKIKSLKENEEENYLKSEQQETMEIEQPTISSSSNLPISPSSAFFPPQNHHQLLINLSDLTCKKCPGGRIFNSREHLELHNTNTHRDRPQYCCNQCSAKFSVKRELATHLRIHSGEQPHQCEKCGKEFGTRQLLKKHYLWHNGERSHVCPVCAKAFFQKGHLTQHLMIHKGGRPHKCSLCSKTFIFKFDLNRHLKIHSDRSFVCGRCSKCFQHEVELKGHILNCKNSSENVVRRNKRYSKRKDSLFSQNNSSNSSTLVDDQIATKMMTYSNKTGDENNNEQNLEFSKQNEQALNVSISSSSSKELQQLNTSPTICHQIKAINPQLSSLPLPQISQQQINLNRLNNLIAISKQNIFSSFISNIGGGICQNNNEQVQQQLFPCLLCPKKFANQSAYLYHWTLMHLRDSNTTKTEVEEKPPQPPPIFDTFNNDFSQQHKILQLLATDNYFNSSASPQKPSPICPSTSSSLCSSSASACSSTSTSVDFSQNSLIPEHISSSTISPLQQQINNNNIFLPQFSLFNCQNCLLEKQRLLEKERELIETRSELERFRGLFLRFGVMLGVKNDVFQQNNKNLTEERTSNNQILLLNKNGAAN